MVIKASREITILCKRSIFLLHRTSSENQYSIITEAKAKLEDIKDKFYKLRGLGADSSNRRSWRPSLEEYIEAILFWNYLTNSDLLSFDDFITQYFTLPGCDDPILPVYPEDYIGGLSDFTGELMRYAIFVLGKGKFETACFINDSLQEIERMTSGMRNKKALSKMIGKLDQISSNTRKTENGKFPGII